MLLPARRATAAVAAHLRRDNSDTYPLLACPSATCPNVCLMNFFFPAGAQGFTAIHQNEPRRMQDFLMRADYQPRAPLACARAGSAGAEGRCSAPTTRQQVLSDGLVVDAKLLSDPVSTGAMCSQYSDLLAHLLR
jgi:hypothetical protein